jgi:lysophospholipase L1-like esterase
MCKKWVVIFCLLTGTWTASAQITLPFYADTVFPTYYRQRVTHFLTLLQSKNDIVFLGNSITDGAEWSELFADSRVKNRGISGDISAGVIHRLDATVKGKPAKVFLLIGINDLSRGISPDSVVKNILLIASYLRQETPATALYVQSILPVNNIYGKFETHTNKGELIKQVNTQLQQNASAYHYTFIDLNTVFCDAEGKMNERLTNDGLHLKGAGYMLWKHLVYPYVFNLLPRASILPMPQQLQWESGYFPLYACKTILLKDTALQKEAGLLQQELTTKGIMMQITNTAGGSEPVIEMGIGKTGAPQLPEESYRLQVRPGKIILEANSPHGAFNGIQTLLQLMRDKVMVDACIITDWPAFSWRGYMVDVGRNYQSVDLLKQQIEIMSRYKLNVFHFHATEDIAWRIAIKQYPQLTAPDNMLRNKGQYYSEEELNSLIDYCKERYITFLPEIDMPGHSAAFKTAMKTDMQSDSGLAIIKSILKVFCTTHDFPYLHIGGDEVKITNKNFLPEMIAYAQSLGKKTIGWEPGGNFTNSTIRQLWMDDAGKTSGNSSVQYIDSRHLYLNHMDPLESVVTIFNRQIGGRQQEDKNMLGGTICLWPDRRVANEEDVFRMNPVYPAMLAFAERIWRGGGNPGWVANIGGPGDVRTNEFREFENRLLDQREENFSGLPFLYAQQSGITWKMYGPYSNGGDLSKKFEPETTHLNEGNIKETLRVVGGTVILRHWWYPLVRDIFNEQKENTTWYATTKIWSDEDKTGDFWIGFNNISRSPATDSPQPGTWDNHHSCVWVNGIRVAPPDWKRGGQKGNSEIPLTDEGYEYRAPTRVAFHKGWNEVLIKAPVAGFKGADWQNPVKWMFTFVPAPGY